MVMFFNLVDLSIEILFPTLLNSKTLTLLLEELFKRL